MIRPIIFGKFVLLERVNVGGMAEIYRAKLLNAPNYERYFAIKRILPSLAADAEFLNMFIDEAKITVELNHPNVCQIYELGRLGQSHYIAMEYITGKDVLAIQNYYRKQRKIMSVSQACFIAAQVAQGLDYAHQACDSNGVPLNLIHRDVTPQNVLISFEGMVKLIDFGVARATTKKKKTESGVLKGKYSYMSPEQVQNEEIDYRSDIFSLGVVFWEMLTGRRLFRAESEFAIMTQISECEIDPPSKLNKMVPPEVDRIAMRALEKDRTKRYQFAGEMAIDLWNFINSCKPPFTQWHLQNWMCTHFASDLQKEWEKLPTFQAINTPEDVERARAASEAEAQNSNETLDKQGNVIPSIEADANASLIAELFSSGAFDLDTLASNPNPDTPHSAPPVLPSLPPSNAQAKSNLPPVPERTSTGTGSNPDGDTLDITAHIDDDALESSIELIPESVAPEIADPETQLLMDTARKLKQKRILTGLIVGLASLLLIILLLMAFNVIHIGKQLEEMPNVATIEFQITNAKDETKDSAIVKLYGPEGTSGVPLQEVKGVTSEGYCTFSDLELKKQYFVEVSLDGYKTEVFSFFAAEGHGNLKSHIELSNPIAAEVEFNVHVTPEDAEIYLNGKLVEGSGETRTLKSIEKVECTITAKKNGYATIEQKYVPGTKESLDDFSLEKGVGNVTLRSIPDHADVWREMDGTMKRVCQTPCTLEEIDPEETLNVEVRMKGYSTWKRSIVFGDKFERKYLADMQR